MPINKLKHMFSENEVTEAYRLVESLDSEQTIEAVIGLSEGNLDWLKKYTKLAKKNEKDIIQAYKVKQQEKETEKDLWISRTEKIKWIYFDAKTAEVKPIDNELESIKPFIKSLEICCHALCCGIRAFSFQKKDLVTKFNEQDDKEKVRVNLKAIIDNISKMEVEVLSSSVLNQLTHKSVLLKLLKHIESCLPST